MSVKKAGQKWQAYAYDPALKRKRYAGTADRKRDAVDLAHAKATEWRESFEGHEQAERAATGTLRSYVAEWLEVHHGRETRRPAPITRTQNEQKIAAFLAEFGDLPLNGGVSRQDALKWAKRHKYRARAVSAMYNDAIDDGAADANPFANRRVKHTSERRHIAALTEAEVDRLTDVALKEWGPDGYGLTARAWVLFGAWVGTRPGETFTTLWEHLDFDAGTVLVKRKKGLKQWTEVVLPAKAADAIRAIPDQAARGLVFRTVTGQPIAKGALAWYWHPVRAAFRSTVTAERWDELLGGQKHFDFYLLRHHCGSQIVAAGGNEFDVAAQLGNTPQVCRRTYIHSYREEQLDRNRGFLDSRGDRGSVVPMKQRRSA